MTSTEIAAATNITNNSFTANWYKVDNVDSYSLELAMLVSQDSPSNTCIIQEGMEKFKVGYSDGYDDLSENLDYYMDNKGWKGQSVFTSQYGAKIGTTSTKGYLISPMFNTGESDLTLRFNAKSLTSAGSIVKFELLGLNGNSIESYECKVYYQLKQFVINIEGIKNKDVRLCISSVDRLYLAGIYVYSGIYNEEDFNSTSSVNHMRSIPCFIVDDIVGTSYNISNLSGENYQYRVRANMNGAQSGWSKYQEVIMSDESGIMNVESNKEIKEYDMYNLN